MAYLHSTLLFNILVIIVIDLINLFEWNEMAWGLVEIHNPSGQNTCDSKSGGRYTEERYLLGSQVGENLCSFILWPTFSMYWCIKES